MPVHELQMWMNVLMALTGVMIMQPAITLKGVILAHATVDTMAMGFVVLVSSIYQPYLRYSRPNIWCSYF